MSCLSSSDKLKIKDKQLNKDLTFEEIIKRDVVQVFVYAAFKGVNDKATFIYIFCDLIVLSFM